jgi:phospholipase/carboxylesterase
MTDPRRPSLSLASRIRDPASATDGRPPLLLLLHGVGSNELAMAALAPSFDPRFLIDFTPDGPLIDVAEARAGWDRAVAFVNEAVEVLGADPERVFLAGFSQGGIVSLAAMLTAPEKVAGAVCMSGRLPPELLPFAADADRLRGKPILIVHGTRDQTLPVDYGRRAASTLAGLPLEVEYRELDLGHTTSPESIALVDDWLAARLDA